MQTVSMTSDLPSNSQPLRPIRPREAQWPEILALARQVLQVLEGPEKDMEAGHFEAF